MTMKWRYAGGALVLAFTVAAMPLEAQRGQGGPGRGFQGPGGPNMGRSLELALEHKDDLQLTEAQVDQIQEMKAVIDGDVAGLVEEMAVLRESIRSGDVDRNEGLRQMQALRGELVTASAPLRGRIQEIFTVDQHNKLQPLVQQGRPGLGRAGGMAMQGQPRGVRGGSGPRSGFIGQGRAPALGFRQGVPGAGFGGSARPGQISRRGRWGELPSTDEGAGLLP